MTRSAPPLSEQALAALADRVARQEVLTRELAKTLRADPPRRDESAFDTPPDIPWPKPRPALLPDGFLLYDVVAALPDAVVALDPAGRVRLWNPAAAALFGWSHVAAVGGPPPFVPVERLNEHQRMVELVRAGAAVRDVTTERLTAGGGRVAVTASAAADAGGGVVFTFRRAGPPPESPAKARLETLGRLLAGVAHDVNNVLTVVCGNAELLGDALPTGSPAGEHAAAIFKAGEHAAAVTRQLLRLARSEPAAPVPVDVSELLAGLGPLLRAVAGAGVRVVLTPGRDLDPVLADPTKLEQIVLNLAANARDAMPAGGTLGVRAAMETVARPGLPAGCYVRLSVADTGSGIDPATKARMFEPFVTTKGPAGTGLGLATVAAAAAELGGVVECDTDPGLGTLFRVYLPAIPTGVPAD